MSLVPFLLNELLEDYRRPSNGDLFDQHFGLGLSDVLHHPRQSLAHAPIRSGYLRPWRHMEHADSGISTITNDKNEFKVNLDVQQFKPDELKVTVESGFVVVNGMHEERSDEHGFISRQFTRKYKIPDDVDPNALASKLSSDGVLHLHAPKLVKVEEKKAREIPISHTNQPLDLNKADTRKIGKAKQVTKETKETKETK